MGYRSNVLMAIAGKPDQLAAFIATLRLKHLETEKAFTSNEFKYATFGDDRVLVLEGSGWKWYPDYDDVRSFEAVWSLADDYSGEFDLIGSFVRIGEDDNDAESRSFGDDGWELASLNRTIETSFEYDVAPDPLPPNAQALPRP